MSKKNQNLKKSIFCYYKISKKKILIKNYKINPFHFSILGICNLTSLIQRKI